MFPSPKPKRISQTFNSNQYSSNDLYSWMRDQNWPSITDKKIIQHLENEKIYFERSTYEFKEVKVKLLNELKNRIPLNDESVPIKRNQYYYYQYTIEGSEYPIYARRHGGDNNSEEIINPNNLINDSNYLRLGCVSVSNDHQKLGYSYETDGTERYKLYLKNLENNQNNWKEVLFDVASDIVWDSESNGFYYTKRDNNWKVLDVWYHRLGTAQNDDILVYREEDFSFEVSIRSSASKVYLFITAESSDTTECRYISLVNNSLEAKLIRGRKFGHLYYPEHYGEYFYFRTNDINPNFRITKQKIDSRTDNEWFEVIPHVNDNYLSNFYFAENFYVVNVRFEGLNKFFVYDHNDFQINYLEFPDPCYSASIVPLEYSANEIRIKYSALNRPETIIDYSYNTKKTEIKKTAELPSGFSQELYVSQRIFANSRDGRKIPISILYRKDLYNHDGTNPLYMYGYGAYGMGSATIPAFNPNLLSLVDRGLIYAICHVRGGDELGREWYEEGRLLNKRNTFNDFEDSLKHLINEKYTKEKKIVISGTSAGGLLIGFALNEYPSLLAGAVAKVPFVDVLNTMLDESLPLTILEYAEWGNPKEKVFYEYIKSYSPYDNIKHQDYPPIYVTAGINDPRVTYWEPAKWVAKLREYKTDCNNILFNISLGHSGSTGRLANLEDIANEYCFVLRSLKINV